MRKLIVACLLCWASTASKAQSTAPVTLTVDLANISAIVIAPAFINPTISYTTQAHYANGVTLNQPDAMAVFSNRPYVVSVVATTDLQGPNSVTIPVNSVTVTPTTATTVSGLTLSAAAIPTGTPAALLTSTTGTVGQTVSLAYSTVGAPTANFLKPAGQYVATVTYSITNP